MSSKRNRFSRSSSQGEVVSFCSIRPITDSPVTIWGKKRSSTASSVSATASGNPVMPVTKNYYSTENRGKIVWTLGSCSAAEDNRGVQVDESFGAFWQACALCKKPLTDQMNIFMYGYLKAFCSVECRHAQIAVDERFGRRFPQQLAASTPNKPGNSSASRLATDGYGSSSQGRRPEAARFN